MLAENTTPKLIPLTKWNEVHLDPPEKTLRKFVFENTFGFNEKVVIRRGRRILIDEAKYFQWLNEAIQQGEL